MKVPLIVANTIYSLTGVNVATDQQAIEALRSELAEAGILETEGFEIKDLIAAVAVLKQQTEESIFTTQFNEGLSSLKATAIDGKIIKGKADIWLHPVQHKDHKLLLDPLVKDFKKKLRSGTQVTYVKKGFSAYIDNKALFRCDNMWIRQADDLIVGTVYFNKFKSVEDFAAVCPIEILERRPPVYYAAHGYIHINNLPLQEFAEIIDKVDIYQD